MTRATMPITGSRGKPDSRSLPTASNSVLPPGMAGTSHIRSRTRGYTSLQLSGGVRPKRENRCFARSESTPGQSAVTFRFVWRRRSSARATADARLSISGLRWPLTRIT